LRALLALNSMTRFQALPCDTGLQHVECTDSVIITRHLLWISYFYGGFRGFR